MYFPMVGVALLVGSLAARIRLTPGRQWAAVTVIGVLVILNVRYQAVWRDEMTLWSHAATVYPNQPRVHNNYGAVLQTAGSQDEAIRQFDLALQVRPDFADAYCNRGSSLGRLHRYADALADQTHALELDPSDAGCWDRPGRSRCSVSAASTRPLRMLSIRKASVVHYHLASKKRSRRASPRETVCRGADGNFSDPLPVVTCRGWSRRQSDRFGRAARADRQPATIAFCVFDEICSP